MASFFTTKITHARLTFSPFSSEQMANLGQLMVDTITKRIRFATDANDNRAKDLVPRYADRKIRRGRAPIRDWTWRGATLGSFKVLRASEDRVTIGFTTAQANQIVATQNARVKMFGNSPKDLDTLHAAVRYMVELKIYNRAAAAPISIRQLVA
jgi:hypothetical protein